MPEEVPELPVHCIIQCQRKFQSFFPSIVLYSARGGSRASRPLYYTAAEEVPELLPVHCILQCERRFRSFPSTVFYSARRGSGASSPLYDTVPEGVPELPVHCIIQCQRRFRSMPSTVSYSARGGSGASRPQELKEALLLSGRLADSWWMCGLERLENPCQIGRTRLEGGGLPVRTRHSHTNTHDKDDHWK